MDKREKKRLAILEALHRSGESLSSARITELLATQDVDISERTVRLYLQELDDEGLTESRHLPRPRADRPPLRQN